MESTAIAPDSDGGTGAVELPPTAGTGIRARDEHEASWQAVRASGVVDLHLAGGKWRPQRLQRVAAELAQFIEVEDAPMGNGGLAGSWWPTAWR